MTGETITRSFVIPVLDFSPHSRYNIRTLLQDLGSIPGEVICIFNSREAYTEMCGHERIDKFCFNNLNAGVSRSWNMGINLAEGRAVFILNADLHILPAAIDKLEYYLFNLENAVIVGPQGSHLNFQKLQLIQYFQKGQFNHPIRTHDVSGFFFGIHRERFLDQKLRYDVRYSPCFMEEWDMGLQVIQAGLNCYAVPVTEFEHDWGISQTQENAKINYFGRDVLRNDVLQENQKKFIKKWFNPKKTAEQYNVMSYK